MTEGVQDDFDDRWLEPGGVVPVDPQTTVALVREIQRLHALLSGDAGFVSAHATEGGGLDFSLTHPIVALMADSLANMLGESNYVEMSMKHKKTGEEYRVHCQKMSRPSPHEFRLKAERRVAELEAQLAERAE